MERGYALTIDYGYAAGEATRFPRGTLLAHYRHATNEDFYERIGRQDLTAHVCWTAMERHGKAAGLATLSRRSQRDFLTEWGWKDYGRWLLAQPGATHERLDSVDRLG
jgi:SAM-dependent MidA family methyltransferase